MRSGCPLNYGLEIFGDKWSLLIIRDLMFFGKHTYNQFLSSEEGISTTVLADRLHMLEQEGIIIKHADTGHKQKILYSLTEKGIDLLPLMLEIGLWSDKYGSDLQENRDFIIGIAKINRSMGVRKWRTKICREHLGSSGK
ncbi:winged helix-turn-helix transcriptional regulator [Chitinophagaceae bacterium MMS25-I14]